MKSKNSIAGIACLVIVAAVVTLAMILAQKSTAETNEPEETTSASTTVSPEITASSPDAESPSPETESAPPEGEKPLAHNSLSKLTSIPAETEKNAKLEAAVIREIGFQSDEDITSTRYYYNAVDLNDDGTDEVFVELVGPYTSGSGGDTGLIFITNGDGYELLQKMTLVRNPVIISDSLTNGWHDIVMTLSGGGGETRTVRMTFDGKKYPNPGDAEAAPEDAPEGVAIISNDFAADLQNGNGLYLTAN